MGTVEGARAVVSTLAAQGVFLRIPGAPPLDRYIRVTVGTKEERESFAEVFSNILSHANRVELATPN